MNRAEFADFLTRRLTADGFSDVRVSVSRRGDRAEAQAVDTNGRRRIVKARLERRRGEDVVVLDTVDDDWIDELEMLDAIFDD